MRKRLFLLFFPLMFLPALLVMLVGWQTSELQLGALAGPGLRRSLASSLELARTVLVRQKNLTQQLADSLACIPVVVADSTAVLTAAKLPGVVWWVWSDQSVVSGDARVPIGGDARGFSRNPADLFPEFSSGPAVAPTRIELSDGSYILAVAPLTNDRERHLVVARPLATRLVANLDAVVQGDNGVRQMGLYYRQLLRTRGLLTLGGLAVLLCAVSLWLSIRLSLRIARPLQELVAGTEKVAGGELSHRVEIDAPDELGQLVAAFNRMTTRLRQSQDELQRAERVAAWQGVARRLAHEIKNPLTPIILAMHRIGNLSADETVTECVETVLEEAANLERLANEFSLYAKLPKPARRRLTRDQLRDLLAGQARFYLTRTRVKYRWVGWQADFTLLVDEGQLRQVLSNLIKNGTEAMAGTGTLTFAVEIRAGSDLAQVTGEHDTAVAVPQWIVLSIMDTGPGLPADAKQIFEPYVTTKANGTGLGLAIARHIINDNGGLLWAASTGTGASFFVALPASDDRGEVDTTTGKG